VESRAPRTVSALGAAVREHRRRLGLTQAALADLAGVGREWVVALESGHPRAQLGRVLQVVAALGLVVELAPAPQPGNEGALDAHLAGLERSDP
jgi:HTH-type transcriptional regulator/antitoxin HipB